MSFDPAAPASTLDTPIDPVTREPIAPTDSVPAPEAPKVPAIQISVLQATAEVQDDAEAPRAVIVTATNQQQPLFELFFTGTKQQGMDIAIALSKPKNVVIRAGLVPWVV